MTGSRVLLWPNGIMDTGDTVFSGSATAPSAQNVTQLYRPFYSCPHLLDVVQSEIHTTGSRGHTVEHHERGGKATPKRMTRPMRPMKPKKANLKASSASSLDAMRLGCLRRRWGGTISSTNTAEPRLKDRRTDDTNSPTELYMHPPALTCTRPPAHTHRSISQSYLAGTLWRGKRRGKGWFSGSSKAQLRSGPTVSE